MNRDEFKEYLTTNLTIPESDFLIYLNKCTFLNCDSIDKWIDKAKVYNLPKNVKLPNSLYSTPNTSQMESSYQSLTSLPPSSTELEIACEAESFDDAEVLDLSDIYSEKFAQDTEIRTLHKRIDDLNKIHSDLINLNHSLMTQIKLKDQEISEKNDQISKFNSYGKNIVMKGKNLIRIKFTEISLQNSLLPKKSHHLYEIFIEVGEEGSPFAETWSVSKRYSEFVNLRSKLSKTHPKIKDLSFPPKLHFALSDEVAHHRKYLLEAWLKIILKHFVDTNPDFQASPTKQTLLVIFNFFQ